MSLGAGRHTDWAIAMEADSQTQAKLVSRMLGNVLAIDKQNNEAKQALEG